MFFEGKTMTDWTVGILALLGLIICEVVRKYRLRPRGCVFVPGHWLLGNIMQHIRAAWQKQQNEHACKQHQMYGRTIALKYPLSSWIVKTTDPKNLEHILKTNFENYTKHGHIRDCLKDLLGNGISVADGFQWRGQRQVACHMFTAQLLQEHIWVVVRRNARKLRDILESTDSSLGKPVDVFNLMNRFTLDTMGEIGFGKCIGSLDDPESPFLHSFDKVQQIVFWRMHNPIWKIMKAMGVDYESETKEHFGRLDQYTRTVVQELIETMDRGSSKSGGVVWADIEARKSFVGLFLEDANNRGEKLSEDYLRDLILNILIAGRDTAAQALSWTVYCLCKNPEVEAKARREVIDVCGVRGPSFDDMPSLPYLQSVIKEALRLYPSVPIDARVAQDDDTLPDGTFIRRGTQVVYDIYSMGRDQEIWGDDAEQFRPERWMEMEQPPSNYEYPVFNAGPRDCLGKNLVMLEMKTCLAFLLPQVSFELAVSADQIMAESQLTLGMSSGLPCIVKAVTAGQHLDSNASTTIHSDSDATSVTDPYDVCTIDGMSEADELMSYQASEFAEDDEDRELEEIGLTRRRSSSFSSDNSGKNTRRLPAHTPHASKVVTKFGLDSDSETTVAEFGVDSASIRDLGAESEATCDEPSGDINEDSTSESAATSRGGRVRNKKRKSGWSRRRRSNFWKGVRDLTPERYPEYSDSGYSSTAPDPNAVAAIQMQPTVEDPQMHASQSMQQAQQAAPTQMHTPQFTQRRAPEPFTPPLQQTPRMAANPSPHSMYQPCHAAQNHGSSPAANFAGPGRHPQHNLPHANFPNPLQPMMPNPALLNGGFQGGNGVFATYAYANANTFMMYPNPALANTGYVNPAFASPARNF